MKGVFKRLFFCITLLGGSAQAVTLEELEKKTEITCLDILSFVALFPIPADPDVNSIWNVAFNFCLSKFVLIGRMQHNSEEEKKIVLAEIRKIDVILGATLQALTLSFVVFSDPFFLRERLLNLYEQFFERGGSHFKTSD